MKKVFKIVSIDSLAVVIGEVKEKHITKVDNLQGVSLQKTMNVLPEDYEYEQLAEEALSELTPGTYMILPFFIKEVSEENSEE